MTTTPGRAPRPVHPLLERVHRFRLALGALILVLFVAGVWFADDLGAMLKHRPVLADFEGAWTFSAERFARQVDAEVGEAPDPVAKAIRQRALRIGAEYQGAIYDFKPGAYAVHKGARIQECPCNYEVVLGNLVRVRQGKDAGGREFYLSLDPANGVIFLQDGDISVPLIRSE